MEYDDYYKKELIDIIEVANFASLPSTGESSKIYVTLDNHKAYRWGGSSYVEISASLVIGTTAGTAYDGASGQTNADNIALKQPILVDSATSGILIDGNNNIDIDLTRTTAETTFDDNELMLIQKTNGDLCRLTKQQLKSSINTNTTYNNGTNITIDGSNNINLNTDLTNMDSISASGDLDLKANDEIILLSGNDGNSSGEDFVFRTNRGSGILEIMRLNGATANLGIDISPHSTYKLNVNGDVNIPTGSNYKIGGTNITDTTYTAGRNLTLASNNDINLDTTLENVNSIESSDNTDLNLQSNDGDILLRCIPSGGSVGYIKLMRSDTARFQTIEYKCHNAFNSYIKFLVHNGTPPDSQTEVLRLKADGSALFSGIVEVNEIESSNNQDLQLQSTGTGDIRLIATPNDSTNGYIHLCRANAPTERFNTIEYSVNGNNSFINFLVQ